MDEQTLQLCRRIFDAKKHQEFLQLRPFRGTNLWAVLPIPEAHAPLASDATVPDSQKVRYELPYLAQILASWSESYNAGMKTELSLASVKKAVTVEKLHMGYTHDGLKYESFPRRGCKKDGGKAHYYLQIPLSNNGYLYRVIAPSDIKNRDISLHKGDARPSGIGGYVSLTEAGASAFTPFATFAVGWFGCAAQPELVEQSVFYNGKCNRVDVVFERKNFPNTGDKVSLEFCFEPGFPVVAIDDSSFFKVTQEYLDSGKKRSGGGPDEDVGGKKQRV